MSLDLWMINKSQINCKCGEIHPLEDETVLSINITSNLAKMAHEGGFYTIVFKPSELKEDVKGKDIAKYLRSAIKDMEKRPSFYKQFNSSNGWGMYKDFLPFLKEYLVACENYPEAKIYHSN